MLSPMLAKAIDQIGSWAVEYGAEGGPRSRRHAILCRRAVEHLVEAQRLLDGVTEREVAEPAGPPKPERPAKPEKP